MAHKHNKAIENNENMGELIDLLAKSKESFIKSNLSIHLHSRELTLIADIKKHNKPHHKKARVAKYAKMMQDEDEICKKYEIHKKIYLNRYKKLENKGLITINMDVDDLPYELTFTEKGNEVLNEISELSKTWEDKVCADFDEKSELIALLQKVSKNAIAYSYAHEKNKKCVL